MLSVFKLQGTEGQAPLQSSEKTERQGINFGDQNIGFIIYEKEKERSKVRWEGEA